MVSRLSGQEPDSQYPGSLEEGPVNSKTVRAFYLRLAEVLNKGSGRGVRKRCVGVFGCEE